MGTSKWMDVLSTSTWGAQFKTITCSHSNCSRWLTQRHLSTRRVGVNFCGSWYCGYRCFASAAQQRFAQLMVSNVSPSQPGLRSHLGLSMVSRGWLSDDQFRAVNEEQKKTGRDIGEIVTRFGFIDEKQLTTARAAQWGCPLYSVPQPITPSALRIPSAFVDLYSMMPLHHASHANNLLIGFVQGVEYGLLYAIEQVTRCKAQPCFITPTDFFALLETQSNGPAAEEMTFDSLQSPVEMTRLICNYGATLDADDVAIVRCKDFIWVRLTGGPKSADLLFRGA